MQQIANPSYGSIIQKSWDSIKANLPLSVGLTVVWSLIVLTLNMIPVVGGFFVSPFTVGYLVCLLKLRQGETFSWEDFFWAFSDLNRFLQLALLALITGLGSMLGFILLILPGVWFMVASMLSTQIFVLGEGDGVAAVKKSMAVVKDRWWWFFGFWMVLGLLNIAGALSLLLGLLFTIPISILASVIVYEQLVQAPELISTSSAAPQPAPIN